MKVRRIVTGVREDGISVVVEDGSPPRQHDSTAPGGLSNSLVWSTEPGRPIPFDGADPTEAVESFVAAPGGTRLLYAEFLPVPDAEPSEADAARAGEDAAALPGIGERLAADGMHTTDTVDYCILLRGRLWLRLDDGSATELHPGDVVVQNGAEHAWENRGSEPALLAAVLIGADRA